MKDLFVNEYEYNEILLREMAYYSFDIKSKEEKTINSRRKRMKFILCVAIIFIPFCIIMIATTVIWKLSILYLICYFCLLILLLYRLICGIFYFMKNIDLAYKKQRKVIYDAAMLKFPKQKARTRILNRWLGNPWYNKKIRIKMTDDRIYTYDIGIDSPFEMLCEWSNINEYVVYNDFIFLYHNETVQYSILPIDKIGFTKGDAESFIAFLYKKRVYQKM